MSWITDSLPKQMSTPGVRIRWREDPPLVFFSPVIPMIDWGPIWIYPVEKSGFTVTEKQKVTALLNLKVNIPPNPKTKR